MSTRNKQGSRTLASSFLSAAILLSPAACSSQRAWNDTTPGPSNPDLADVGAAILGVGYYALYFFAQSMSGGSGTSLDQYSYNSQGWR